MITYHGTSISSAKRLLERKFLKIDNMQNSLWYTINTTNNLSEAQTHANIKKYEDPKELGAILEIQTDDNANIYNENFVNSHNKYRYDIYQKWKYDIINTHVSNWFDIQMIYNYDKIKSIKIIKIIKII